MNNKYIVNRDAVSLGNTELAPPAPSLHCCIVEIILFLCILIYPLSSAYTYDPAGPKTTMVVPRGQINCIHPRHLLRVAMLSIACQCHQPKKHASKLGKRSRDMMFLIVPVDLSMPLCIFELVNASLYFWPRQRLSVLLNLSMPLCTFGLVNASLFLYTAYTNDVADLTFG